MDRTDNDRSDRDPDERERMLARTWVIAANYRSPIDYDIPTAPSFTAERSPDGRLVLLAPDGEDSVLIAASPSKVRR